MRILYIALLSTWTLHGEKKILKKECEFDEFKDCRQKNQRVKLQGLYLLNVSVFVNQVYFWISSILTDSNSPKKGDWKIELGRTDES